jgi:hypothetical protein
VEDPRNERCVSPIMQPFRPPLSVLECHAMSRLPYPAQHAKLAIPDEAVEAPPACTIESRQKMIERVDRLTRRQP